MSELKVSVTGDASGFNQTLANVKASASKLNTDLSAQQKAENKRVQSLSNIAQKGAGLANAAGTIGGIPGTGAAGAAAGQVAGALFGVKEIAENFGMSMAKAGGAVVVFAAAAMAVSKAIEEFQAMTKALTEEMDSQIRAGNVEAQTRKKYMDVLNENKNRLKAEDFKRLKEGVNKNDGKAFAEIRSMFGGTVFNKELRKDAEKARIDAMPSGTGKEIAQENLRFKEATEALRKKVGDNPSQATKEIAAEIFDSLVKEHKGNLKEIDDKKKTGDTNKGGQPGRVEVDSLAKVGLFSSASLLSIPSNIQNQQLIQLREIAANTKNQITFT